MRSPLLLILSLLTYATLAQPIGKWRTIDDESGKARSVIEISERGEKLYGKVVKLYLEPHEDPDPICDECAPSDMRYKKKIIGMEILEGLVKDGEGYGGGFILDPENGKVYRCKIWLEGEILKVRGYWGPLYRTQNWHRAM